MDRTLSGNEMAMRWVIDTEVVSPLSDQYKKAISQIESEDVKKFVILYPESSKMGWSLINCGMIMAGGSKGSPVPLGWPVIGPFNEVRHE